MPSEFVYVNVPRDWVDLDLDSDSVSSEKAFKTEAHPPKLLGESITISPTERSCWTSTLPNSMG